jgi:hypothetical protein
MIWKLKSFASQQAKETIFGIGPMSIMDYEMELGVPGKP